MLTSCADTPPCLCARVGSSRAALLFSPSDHVLAELPKSRSETPRCPQPSAAPPPLTHRHPFTARRRRPPPAQRCWSSEGPSMQPRHGGDATDETRLFQSKRVVGNRVAEAQRGCIQWHDSATRTWAAQRLGLTGRSSAVARSCALWSKRASDAPREGGGGAAHATERRHLAPVPSRCPRSRQESPAVVDSLRRCLEKTHLSREFAERLGLCRWCCTAAPRLFRHGRRDRPRSLRRNLR